MTKALHVRLKDKSIVLKQDAQATCWSADTISANMDQSTINFYTDNASRSKLDLIGLRGCPLKAHADCPVSC